MNIRVIVTALVVAVSISVFAQKPTAPGVGKGPQGQRGPGMRRMGMSPELKKELNLTPAQEKKLEAIRVKYQAKMKAAGFDMTKPPAPGAPRPDFGKLRPIFEAQRKESEAVFTPKQREILKKWAETHGRGMGGGRPGGPGGAPGKGGAGHGGGH